MREAKRFGRYEEALGWFGERVAASASADAIGEPPAAVASVDERLLQCIWHDGLLVGRDLATVARRALVITDPGDWNHEAGPDFRRAELLIDGQPLKGDIEIHIRSSAWTDHGHDRNFDYNSVILHVFLEQTDDRRHELLHNGRAVERLCLTRYLEPDIEALRQTIGLDDYLGGDSERRGRCHAAIVTMDGNDLAALLDLAGDHRLEDKAARFAAQMSGVSLDQVFYQALMTAMGHKSGKALYFLLAKRVPVAELADHASECPPAERVRLIEAILYHVANLVPVGSPTTPLDEESQQYLNALNRHWSAAAGYFADRIIPPTRRWYSGIRPVNFPTRRLAGVAHLLSQWQNRGLVDSALDLLWRTVPDPIDRKSARRMVDRVAEVLEVQVGHYFARRFVWGGKVAAHASSLIGDGQARSILFNAILPMALLAARRGGDNTREAAVFALWRNFPRLPENQVVRLMRSRLFGETGKYDGLLLTEHRNQALFQLFNDCCNNNLADCSQCTLLKKP
jgi:hypothetical protein